MIITLLDIFVCLLFVMFFVVVVVSNTRTQTRHRHMVLEIHILVWDMYKCGGVKPVNMIRTPSLSDNWISIDNTVINEQTEQ